MSSAQPSAHAAAAASSSGAKKRPRHFWEGPDLADEPDEEKQGAAHVSPIARLHRHALESVFGFLKFGDLSVALSVCRSWSSAVRSMGAIKTAVANLHIKPWSIASSSLARHVSVFGSEDDFAERSELTGSDLFILAHHLGWLTELSGSVNLPQPSPLLFGPALQTLRLSLLWDNEDDAAAVNDAIMTISRLPQLATLTLQVPSFVPALSFAPLTSAARLQDLELKAASLEQPIPQHLDQFRMMPRLRRMSVELRPDNLAYLLRAPHALQWQEIHQVHDLGADEAALLSTLPTLTQLLTGNFRSVAFLPALTRLRTLTLYVDDFLQLAADIVVGVSCCPEITNLTLSADDLTSKHMTQLLPRLPLLSRLELSFCPALESLSFFSECAQLAQSLQFLLIQECHNAALHSTELKHVLILKSLIDLDLNYVFADPLDAFAEHLLTPPSLVLPKLQKFHYS